MVIRKYQQWLSRMPEKIKPRAKGGSGFKRELTVIPITGPVSHKLLPEFTRINPSLFCYLSMP